MRAFFLLLSSLSFLAHETKNLMEEDLEHPLVRRPYKVFLRFHWKKSNFLVTFLIYGRPRRSGDFFISKQFIIYILPLDTILYDDVLENRVVACY